MFARLASTFGVLALAAVAEPAAGFGSVTGAQQEAGSKKTVMLLGVYHFNNPGADKFNTKVDDYFSDRRQTELEEVVDLLALFEPTKVFVERMPGEQERLDDDYRLYREDKLHLREIQRGRGEEYQLGFRLAKHMGHDRIHCVDARGLWLGSYVDAVAHDEGLGFYLQYENAAGKFIEERNVLFNERSVLENLIEMNQPESILANHFYYNAVSPRVVDPRETAGTPVSTQEIDGREYLTTAIDHHHIGAELTAEWYKRNIRIYGNILRAINESDERVLVIFGQGHIRILQHLFEDNPGFECISANEFLE